MAQNREAEFYEFAYNDGSPACFAQVEVWAKLRGGTGTDILVYGGNASLQTDGSGILRRISKQLNWVDPWIRLIDMVARRTVRLPFFAWRYKLDWDRPAPFAEFDGQQFTDVGDYLDYLATRYGFLSSVTPSPLTFSLNRVGSPPEFQDAEVISLYLQDALDQASQGLGLLDPSDPDLDRQLDDNRLKPGRRVLWSLSGLIPVGARTSGRHTRATMAAAYLQMLRRIASGRESLRLREILKALYDALPHPLNPLKKKTEVINELEDWALAGLLVFLAGLNAYGYVFASNDGSRDWMETTDITMVLSRP